MIPSEDLTDVTLVSEDDDHNDCDEDEYEDEDKYVDDDGDQSWLWRSSDESYLVIKVVIVKEVMTCDVAPVALFQLTYF